MDYLHFEQILRQAFDEMIFKMIRLMMKMLKLATFFFFKCKNDFFRINQMIQNFLKRFELIINN